MSDGFSIQRYPLDPEKELASRGGTVVHKFGKNGAAGTSFTPISIGGIYRTPQVGSATALRIKAGGDSNDTAAGSGAREVTLIGIDETGAEVTEVVATAGASASSNTTTTFIRLYRAYVSSSGTYATSTAGSHSGDIVIEDSAGTQNWATIDSTDFPKGQTEIGVYTVPNGKRAFIQNIFFNVENTKRADILGFQRPSILQTSAPYDSMRLFIELGTVGGKDEVSVKIPIGPFEANTDIGFMGKVGSGTGEIDVDFEILLEDA